MNQIECLENLNDVKICKCIIILVILAYQPLHLKELGAIADSREELSSLEELVQLCGSFLTIREDMVYLVHQSAKGFFTTGKASSIISSSRQEGHGKTAYRSLDLMLNTLREDMCDLQKPGTSVAEAYRKFRQSHFTHVGYACCYWVDHLTDASRDEHDQLSPFNNGERVKMFLQEHLHWLEILSVLGKVSKGVIMLKHLQLLIDVSLLIRWDYSSRHWLATLSSIQTKIFVHLWKAQSLFSLGIDLASRKRLLRYIARLLFSAPSVAE